MARARTHAHGSELFSSFFVIVARWGLVAVRGWDGEHGGRNVRVRLRGAQSRRSLRFGGPHARCGLLDQYIGGSATAVDDAASCPVRVVTASKSSRSPS